MNTTPMTTTLRPTRIAGLFVSLMGAMVCLGWIADIRVLTTIIPGYTAMKMNSALLLVLLGIGIYTYPKQGQPRVLMVIAGITGATGLFSLLQTILHFNIGIDEWLIRDKYAVVEGALYPGRMALNSAICFTLLGVGFLFHRHTRQWIRVCAQIAFHIVTLISLLAIIGYLMNVPAFYQLSSLASMAIHTAIALGMISVVGSLYNKELGITGLFTGMGIGNLMARRLFPFLACMILLLALIRIGLHRYQLVSVEFGIALFAISFLLVSLFTIWNTANILNRINARKNVAENNLVSLNRNLEQIIANRTSELSDNIHKLQQSESKLWKSQQMLRGIVNNTSAAVFVKDVTGHYILVNAKFESDLGVSNDDIHLKTAFDIFPEEIARNLSANEPEIVQTGKGITLEVIIPNGDDYKVMLTNKFPLFDENQQVFALCGISTDITDLKKSKNDQEILSTQLQTKNQQLLNFAHITSHNLRSPVSNLNSLLWLYNESETAEEKAVLFEKFETVIHNLSQTLNELVDALKIQEDTGKKRETLHFEEVFKKVKESMAGKILETEAVVSYHFSKAPVIEYPRLYLESILQNLLSNSLKYRSPKRTPVIHAETHFENGTLVLNFSDNGLGIDMARHKEKLFGLNKIFHRHEEAKGVGLFIVKTQVEAMGGHIYASSEVDKGTTFSIHFNKSV